MLLFSNVYIYTSNSWTLNLMIISEKILCFHLKNNVNNVQYIHEIKVFQYVYVSWTFKIWRMHGSNIKKG
jgi:hypothetical protein